MSEDTVAIRPAATMLLLRDGADGMEVFMVVRHHQIDFASGALVFPGGSVDPDDATIAADAGLHFGAGGMDAAALAFRIGAVRETFEECGILLARPHGSTSLVAAARVETIAAACRQALCDGSKLLSEVLSAEKLTLALDLLVPFAHWITPRGMPKRFDTHFYLAVAPNDQVGAHDGTESVDSIWVQPNVAVEAAKAGKFKLVFATERNLIKLGRQNSTEAALESARADTIVTVSPEVFMDEQVRKLRIPAEAGYGGSVFEVRAP